MKYFRFFCCGALLFLGGCATVPPAPVYEAARDLPVEEKPEPRVRRPQSHTIRAGETLAEIALEYGLDHRELALWNGIADPDVIYTGDVIRLSPSEALPTASAVPPQKPASLSPASSARIAKPGATAPQLAPAPAPAPETAATAAETIAPTIAPASSGGETQTVARGNAPIKDGPVAAKYAYNAKTLRKLRAEHAAGSAPSVAAPQTAAAAPSPSAAAPQQVRRRFDVDWSWPTNGKVAGKFSEASKGIDIAGAKGAPVYAAAAGKVVYTGSGVKSYGRLVILKHGNDYLSAYAHNDKILAKEGQKVARGEQIATIGDSGAAKVMLHLEIRKSGKPFDPLQVLPPKP
ncbi:MAG: peptidoglycan DD-metalloendopeptidase family protein [Gammaproteobacteria bacterium]